MAGVHASDGVSGHLLDPAISAPPAQGATNAAGITGDAATLPPTGTRTYLEVSAAAQGYGAEGVYTNGRYRDHGSPRIGSGSRDNSAERSQGAGNTPCGIMKVGDHLFSLSPILKVTQGEFAKWRCYSCKARQAVKMCARTSRVSVNAP